MPLYTSRRPGCDASFAHELHQQPRSLRRTESDAQRDHARHERRRARGQQRIHRLQRRPRARLQALYLSGAFEMS